MNKCQGLQLPGCRHSARVSAFSRICMYANAILVLCRGGIVATGSVTPIHFEPQKELRHRRPITFLKIQMKSFIS